MVKRRSNESLGERLRFARELAGISARGLDDAADVTQGHTSLLESGKRENVETKTASKFAAALGVSLDWLVNGTGEAPTVKGVTAALAEAGARKAS